jgi:hypothetical protein
VAWHQLGENIELRAPRTLARVATLRIALRYRTSRTLPLPPRYAYFAHHHAFAITRRASPAAHSLRLPPFVLCRCCLPTLYSRRLPAAAPLTLTPYAAPLCLFTCGAMPRAQHRRKCRRHEITKIVAKAMVT